MEVYSGKTEEELFYMIGSEVSGQAGISSDYREIVERGRRWFELKLPQLHDVLCSNSVVISISENPDEAALAAVLIDIVSNLALGISPATIISLIMRIGLKRFCETD